MARIAMARIARASCPVSTRGLRAMFLKILLLFLVACAVLSLWRPVLQSGRGLRCVGGCACDDGLSIHRSHVPPVRRGAAPALRVLLLRGMVDIFVCAIAREVPWERMCRRRAVVGSDDVSESLEHNKRFGPRMYVSSRWALA